MAKNIIIGMGGTGAKLMESFVHLCASGLGPEEEVMVGLIEQDVANGNTARTISSLSNYMAARKLLRGNTGPALPADCDFLRSRLVPLSSREEQVSELVWKPNDQANATIASIIGLPQLPPETADLIRCLFSDAPGESNPDAELAMTVNEGYRAKPHLGATAFLYAVEGSDWWGRLAQKIKAATDHDLRIFLFASAFGGTGAAFFPTVAKEIREIARQNNINKLRVSGALMTPYFGFPQVAGQGNFARSEHMVQQTKAALSDYVDMVNRGNVFDVLYLVGNDPPAVVPKFAPGNQNQKNAPLVPELMGALAAVHDLTQPVVAGSSGSTKVMQIARAAEREFKWDDLPRLSGKPTVQSALGQALRFAWQWRFNFRHALNTDHAGDLTSEAWFQKILGSELGGDAGKEAFSAVDKVVDDLLLYALGLAAMSDTVNQDQPFLKLWQPSSIGTFDARSPDAQPQLPEGLGEPQQFERLIYRLDNQPKPFPGAARVFRAVHDEPDSVLPKGTAKLVATVYRHCAIAS